MNMTWTEELRKLVAQRKFALKRINQMSAEKMAAIQFLETQLCQNYSRSESVQVRILQLWRDKIIKILPSAQGGHAGIRTKWINRINHEK